MTELECLRNSLVQQYFRYCIPKELWTEHKGYAAYPWDYKGNPKI